jgi:hypothetical protein
MNHVTAIIVTRRCEYNRILQKINYRKVPRSGLVMTFVAKSAILRRQFVRQEFPISEEVLPFLSPADHTGLLGTRHLSASGLFPPMQLQWVHGLITQRILLEVPNRRKAWRVQDQALPIKFVELNRGPNLLWGLNRRRPFQERDFLSAKTANPGRDAVERWLRASKMRRNGRSGRTMSGSFPGRILTSHVSPAKPDPLQRRLRRVVNAGWLGAPRGWT